MHRFNYIFCSPCYRYRYIKCALSIQVYQIILIKFLSSLKVNRYKNYIVTKFTKIIKNKNNEIYWNIKSHVDIIIAFKICIYADFR